MSVVVVREAADAAVAIDRFPNNNKLISWLGVRLVGLPALSGVVFDRLDGHEVAEVLDFARSIGADRLLLRSDKPNESGTYPRGGFLVRVRDLRAETAPFLDEARTLFLLEPRSPYSDLYSVGALAWPNDPIIVIEVVGPGFDSSDLKRGDLSAHERFRFDRRTGAIVEQDVQSPGEYAASWRHRLRKVGMMLARQRGLGNALAPAGLPEDAIRESLEARGETMLLEAEDGYARIPREFAMAVFSNANVVGGQLAEHGLPGEPLMLSMSYFGHEAEPIYWDVVWPKLKYDAKTMWTRQ